MAKLKKDETDMQTATLPNQVPPLPLPQNEKKRLMQAEVNLDLFNAVSKEMERKGLKIRQVMEWGLRAYLKASNPKEASRLGINSDDE